MNTNGTYDASGSKRPPLAALALPAVLFGLTACCLGGGADPGQADADREQRLTRLCERLESQHEKADVPGMAIVVVKDNRVILSRVFGFANVEEQVAVTDDTLFSLGSSAKAFTATLIAMLVTEGKMDWDDPVTKFLPDFRLAIDTDDKGACVTIRDLLCHRTGFWHMELVQRIFSGPDGVCSREGLLREAVTFKPKDRFREQFNYNNIGFLAAGSAAGNAAGTDWDSLMAKRVFTPLGMRSATTRTSEARKNPHLATGYMEGNAVPLKDLDAIGPAGGILASIRDMAPYLRLMLNGGVYRGKRLVGEAELHEMWKRHMRFDERIIPGQDYGLGWMLTKWQGHKVVHHPGNSVGFSGDLALIPDQNLGFVMLSNALPNPLQLEIQGMVWEAVLGKVATKRP